MKYRILKETSKAGEELFYIQKKILGLFWVKIIRKYYTFYMHSFWAVCVFDNLLDAEFYIEEKQIELQEKKNKKVISKEIINYPK